jgi:hypothetical protein
VKTNLSKQTLLMVGDALEMSVAHLMMADCPTGAARADEALTRLRRALRVPKEFSFTSERVAREGREQEKWAQAARVVPDLLRRIEAQKRKRKR